MILPLLLLASSALALLSDEEDDSTAEIPLEGLDVGEENARILVDLGYRRASDLIGQRRRLKQSGASEDELARIELGLLSATGMGF